MSNFKHILACLAVGCDRPPNVQNIAQPALEASWHPEKVGLPSRVT